MHFTYYIKYSSLKFICTICKLSVAQFKSNCFYLYKTCMLLNCTNVFDQNINFRQENWFSRHQYCWMFLKCTKVQQAQNIFTFFLEKLLALRKTSYFCKRWCKNFNHSFIFYILYLRAIKSTKVQKLLDFMIKNYILFFLNILMSYGASLYSILWSL